MNIDVHFFTLLTMVAAGVFATSMFDTYKQLFRPKAFWSKVIVDTLFMLTQSCLVYYLLFITNGGVIRFYLFLAILLGISFYFAILQPVYLNILDLTIRAINKLYMLFKRLVNSVIVKPITWVVELLFSIVISIVLLLWKIILAILKVIKVILKPLIPTIVQKYLMNLLTICSNILSKTKNMLVQFWTSRRRKNGEGKSKKP
ncbi:spore cortex biosynthesis protein YabQ [Bacillaceae bacterium W0354]